MGGESIGIDELGPAVPAARSQRARPDKHVSMPRHPLTLCRERPMPTHRPPGGCARHNRPLGRTGGPLLATSAAAQGARLLVGATSFFGVKALAAVVADMRGASAGTFRISRGDQLCVSLHVGRQRHVVQLSLKICRARGQREAGAPRGRGQRSRLGCIGLLRPQLEQGLLLRSPLATYES